jgi:hypothetical protein
MNTKDSLIKALSNDEVRYFLERYNNFSNLLSLMETEQRPQKFIATVMLLASLREVDPTDFEMLVASYEKGVIKEKSNELVKLLAYLLEFFPGLDYTINGKKITVQEIADALHDWLLTGTTVNYEFSIETYRVTIEMGNNNIEDPFCKVKLYKQEQIVENLHCITLTAWSKLFKHEKMMTCIEQLLDQIGRKGMYSHSSDKLSVLGHIVTDKSVTAGKKVPAWFNSRRKEIEGYTAAGNVSGMELLLNEEYAKQQEYILPTALQILHNFGAELLKNCKRIKKLTDSRISLLDKIQLHIAHGSFSVMRVPIVKGISPNERKTFLLSCRDEYQIDLIAQVLAQAGWAGSLLIASSNFPSIHEILDTKQADYVLQSELGHSHEKDLYEEELKLRPDSEELKGKVLQCLVSRRESIPACAKNFTLAKIEESCLTSIKMQEM